VSRRRFAQIVALVGAVVAVTAMALTLGADTPPTPTPPALDPNVFAQPTVMPDGPPLRRPLVLTAAEQQQALATALSDARVKRILDGHAYQVADVVIWTGADLRVIGAVVTLAFDEPTTIAGEWTEFSWDCDQDPVPPPITVPYAAQYAGVTELIVFANAEKNAVEQLLPFSMDGPVELVGKRTFLSDVTDITSCGRD
jgi:hypothetical protein